MRILIILLVLAQHVIFSFDASFAAGGVSIGGFRVDGRNYGGVVLPNRSYGPIHQKTEINGLGGPTAQINTNEDHVCEDDINPSKVPIVINDSRIAPVKGGFARTKARELLKQNE